MTGATGLLGGFLQRQWRAEPIDLVTVGHGKSADDSVDLTDSSGVARLLDKHVPDVIVNLAAFSNVDGCEGDHLKAYLLNTRAVELLAGWVRGRQSSTLIQISTDHVYDGPGAHKEEDVTLLNMYAMSKYFGELAALVAGGMVLRVNFFGQSLTEGRESFSDTIVKGLRARKDMCFFTDVFFSPLSLESLSGLILKAVRDPEPGVFNLGAGSGLSKFDFAKLVAGRAGVSFESAREVLLEQIELPARRPRGMVMDSGRFQKRYQVDIATLEEEITQAMQ